MATTGKDDKKRNKKEKKKHQKEPEQEKDDSKRSKKKQKLHEAAAAAAGRKEVDKVRAEHDKKGKNKKIKYNNNKQQLLHDRESGGGSNDPERKGKKNWLIKDERFALAHSDPRFQRMPRRESKVVIDSRFARMFSDKSFADSSAPVDKRGKPRRGKPVNPLLHYYLHQHDGVEEEEPAGPEGSVADMKMGETSSESEKEVLDEEEEEEEELLGPESDANASSSTEEDDDEDDECSVNSDIARYLMANHEDTPMIEHETPRLAVVNMDWEHIKAVDLYVVMSSCLPKGGQILSVSIYPSEFGLKCMEVEAVRGPSALFDNHEEHSEDDSETDDETLRNYELNKLRYYYAVVVCDSSATANHIYKTLDGTELLDTSNVFDLRFIPDSMEFKHPPRDIRTEAPTSYEEPDFHTRALQHSKVKLTWEEDEPHRTKILRRKFNPNQLDELNEYLASSGESDDDDDENDRGSDGDEKDDAAALPNGAGKKRIDREKLLSLLQPEDDSDAGHSDDKDMEITFNTGLEDLSKRILEKKDKKSETVWEAVLRKKSEKKKARKKSSKYSSEDDSSDFDVQEAPDQPDDFFVEEESVGTDAKASAINKKDKSVRRGRKGRDQSTEINKEQEASRAELELLLADDQGADHGPKGYNLKPKKVKGKKGKDMPDEDKLPDVDYKDDPRFSALFSSHLFALDPTDPQFKRSAAYARQRTRKQGTGGRDEATEEEARNPSEQDRLKSDDAMPNTDENLHKVEVPSSANERHDFSSTVRSLKRNLVTMGKEPKGR